MVVNAGYKNVFTVAFDPSVSVPVGGKSQILRAHIILGRCSAFCKRSGGLAWQVAVLEAVTDMQTLQVL